MSNRIDLPPTHSAEVQSISFNFLSQLLQNETVSSGNASVVVYSGAELSPALTIGATSSAPSFVLVSTSTGTPGVIYELTITATTNLSNTYVQRALLAVLPNPE